MSRINLIVATLIFVFIATVQGEIKEEIMLFPNEERVDDVIENGRYKSVGSPLITIHAPEKAKANGKAVVICPGGGYSNLVMDREGHLAGEWFAARGYVAAILKYRLPQGGDYQRPIGDALRAMEIMRERSAEWGVESNKIGVMGFSAGGHLASSVATHYTTPSNRPDFAILVYPVITMDIELTHKGSRNQLIGKEATEEMVDRFSNEKQVTGDTPPVIVFFCDDDKTVDSRNGTAFYDATKAAGVSAELHIYPSGGHGWGFRESFRYRDEFLTTLLRWLSER